MDEYVILPLGGEPKNPIRLLVAGNTAGRAPYQRRVVQDGETLLGLANLASQTSTAINNASFYQALEWERQSLEEKVRERTRELSRSLEELRAAQDRLILLEMKVRCAEVLPAGDDAKLLGLTPAQIIALRFASDEELGALLDRAVREKLSPKQIKQAIRHWRPDELRT